MGLFNFLSNTVGKFGETLGNAPMEVGKSVGNVSQKAGGLFSYLAQPLDPQTLGTNLTNIATGQTAMQKGWSQQVLDMGDVSYMKQPKGSIAYKQGREKQVKAMSDFGPNLMVAGPIQDVGNLAPKLAKRMIGDVGQKLNNMFGDKADDVVGQLSKIDPTKQSATSLYESMRNIVQKSSLDDSALIHVDQTMSDLTALSRGGVNFRVPAKQTAEPVGAFAGSKELLNVHNLTERKLNFADRVGGLPNPSIAVINPKVTSFESFGDITLVAPKNIIRGQKTTLADAYTARFPSLHTSISDDSFKTLQKDLEVYYKKIGPDAKKIVWDDTDMVRQIENNPAVALKFLESKGITPSPEGQHYFHSQINENKALDAEFQSFLDDIYSKYGLEEKLFAGYTPSGNRRYTTLSLENASKIMSKQKDEGFDYGLGSIRSKIAPRYTTPEAVKKEAGRLVTKEQFDIVKESGDNKLWSLKEKLEPYAINKDSNPFTENDRQINAIGEILKGEKDGLYWFKNKFPDAPQDIINEVYSFRDELKKMPTEYFETKFKRPVSLSEFSIAVVPEETSERSINLLKKNGLEVIKYPKGQKQSVLQSLLTRPEAYAFTGLVGGGGLFQYLNNNSTPQFSDRQNQ